MFGLEHGFDVKNSERTKPKQSGPRGRGRGASLFCFSHLLLICTRYVVRDVYLDTYIVHIRRYLCTYHKSNFCHHTIQKLTVTALINAYLIRHLHKEEV